MAVRVISGNNFKNIIRGSVRPAILTIDGLFSSGSFCNIFRQSKACYRAAVLHEIGQPLVIEDIKPQIQLKSDEVFELHSMTLNNFLTRFTEPYSRFG